MFFATRNVMIGYYGYKINHLPDLSNESIEFLKTLFLKCETKDCTKDCFKKSLKKFKARYGSHFIAGSNNGAQVQVTLKYDKSKSKESSETEASLSISW